MKKIVLLIDDEVITNTVNQMLLEKTNLVGNVESVNNGHEAIHFLESLVSSGKSLPDAIFLDINMPYMNGFEFLIEIQKHKAIDYHKLNVIMLSSSFDPKDKQRAREAGILLFLEKPLSFAAAIDVLK